LYKGVPADLKSVIGSYERKLFVGIGNVLKSDDGIGVYIARQIRESDKIKTLVVEVTIENYLGKINHIPHDILILVDAVDFQREPGFFRLLTPEEIMDYTATTHNISISKLLGFFMSPVLILGIQPQSISLGENISKPVKKQADLILKWINAV
jgi:hydrogenase 3 maturation protease